MMLVLNLTSIAIVWFGSNRIDAGQMQVGALFAFLQYAMQILFAMLMLSVLFVMLPRATASAARINAVLDMRAGDHRSRAARMPTGDRHGYVEFEDVTFSYPGAEEPAISRHLVQRAPRPGDGDHRRHRLGQVDARQPDPALLRRR